LTAAPIQGPNSTPLETASASVKANGADATIAKSEIASGMRKGPTTSSRW
jgi:hypothetical protein